MNDLMPEFEYRIRLAEAKSEYWDWMCKNVPIGSWKAGIPLTGITETYYFKDEGDLLTFKLVFGV